MRRLGVAFFIVALLAAWGSALMAQGQSMRIVTFRVYVPENTPTNETIYLLTMPWRTFTVTQHVPLQRVSAGVMEGTAMLEEGAVVRYTYDRWEQTLTGSDWAATRECAGESLPIDCRLLVVSARNSTVEDTVAAWADISGSPGRGVLRGTVTDALSGKPLPDTDVTAGGIHIATRYDGTFEFPELAAGSQRVTVYRALGEYHLAEAVATVRDGQTTDLRLAMTPAQPVDVSFNVVLPTDTPPDAQIRLIGSAYQMGSRISGSSLNSPQMPAMNFPVMARAGSQATLTLHLYDGMYAQYWYTVSDPWYGCEKGESTECVFRSLIVSTSSALQQDEVSAWRNSWMTRLSIYVTVPGSTPSAIPVAFKTGPAYWMTPVGQNRWVFHCYGYPGQTVGYRFMLGSWSFEGEEAGGTARWAQFGDQDREVQDVVTAWQGIPAGQAAVNSSAPAALPGFHFTLPSEEFLRGFCLFDYWGGDPFSVLLDTTFDRIRSHGGTWVEVSSIWSYGTVTPLPTLESRPLLSSSVLTPRQDLVDEIRLAHDHNLEVLIAPQCNMEMTQGRDALAEEHAWGWWQAWLEEAEAFWMWNAQVAEEAGAEALLLPGYVFHAFPGKSTFMSLKDARAFDAAVQSIIAKVREVYHGKLVLGITPTGFVFPSLGDWIGRNNEENPDLSPSASADDWAKAYDALFMRTLDTYYWANQKKPVLLYHVGICPKATPADPTGERVQARQFQGFISALSTRPWVIGMFQFAYSLMDEPLLPGCSVRGRLAEEVIAQFYGQ